MLLSQCKYVVISRPFLPLDCMHCAEEDTAPDKISMIPTADLELSMARSLIHFLGFTTQGSRCSIMGQSEDTKKRVLSKKQRNSYVSCNDLCQGVSVRNCPCTSHRCNVS